MDEELTTLPPFELVKVLVADEAVLARPVKWDREADDGEGHDADGKFITPIAYECVCPHCGNMVIFDAGHESLRCPECGVGTDAMIQKFVPLQLLKLVLLVLFLVLLPLFHLGVILQL